MIFLMKTLPKNFRSVLLITALFAFQSMAFANDVEGVWSYEASGTLPEYSEGEITIKKVEGAYQVVLTVGQMAIDIDEVTVEGRQVDFIVYIQDAKVEVTLTIDGDNMTGKAASYDGTYPLKGKRK